MRLLPVVLLSLFLAACGSLPPFPGMEKEQPPTEVPAGDPNAAGKEAVLKGYEYLHQGNYKYAEAKFNTAIDALPRFDAGQIHARIGKVLVYVSPDSDFRDLDRAQATLNEINILTKRAEMTNTVWEQTLILSVSQLVDASVKARSATRQVKSSDSREMAALKEEVAKLQEQNRQANETIAKLRSLTLEQ